MTQRKTIGIITIHRVTNFGSVLQTFATQRFLESLECDVTVIDYIAPRLTLRNIFNDIFIKRRREGRLYQKISGFISMEILNRFVFNRFLKKHIKLSKDKYYSLEDIEKDFPKQDYYMTGSDQVWNSFYNKFIDPVFFLNFAEGTKISFASSFGREKIDDKELGQIKLFLNKYKNISVRENSGVELLQSMGFDNIQHLVDPTLLFTKQDWFNLLPLKVNKKKTPYVLIYPMSVIDPTLFTLARQVANEINGDVYFLGSGLKTYKQADRTFKFQSPIEFLSLINNAEFVVTNSFHGTLFSITFNKKFLVVRPEKFHTRIQSILELLHLEDRVYSGQENVAQFLEDIDYTTVNVHLEIERIKSKSFIVHALNN